MKSNMRAERVINPESMVSTLNDKTVSGELSCASLVSLNCIAYCVRDMNQVLLYIVTFWIWMGCFK